MYYNKILGGIVGDIIGSTREWNNVTAIYLKRTEEFDTKGEIPRVRNLKMSLNYRRLSSLLLTTSRRAASSVSMTLLILPRSDSGTSATAKWNLQVLEQSNNL